MRRPLALIVLVVWSGAALAQVSGAPQGDLAGELRLEELGAWLRPPKFWQPLRVAGARTAAWVGPGEYGAFPRLELIGNDGALEVLDQRGLLRGRVRVRLMEGQAEAVELLDESDREVGGRTVLQELYSFTQGGRPMSAMACHFSSPSRNYTLIFTHATEAFDARLGTVEELLESVRLDGEESSLLTWLFLGFCALAAAAWGFWHWYRQSRRQALKAAGIVELDYLKAQDEARGGGLLVFGDEDEDFDAPMDAETGFKILDLSKRDERDERDE